MIPDSLNRWIYGRVVYPGVVRAIGEGTLFRRLKSLESIQWWPANRLAELQQQRLADLLNIAATQTEHYKEILKGRTPVEANDALGLLRSLPLLSKTDVQNKSSDLSANPAPGRVTRKTTGGSTGQAVTILKDRSALAFERAAMWLGYGWAGIHIGDRCARFWGSQFDGRRRLVGRAGDFAMNRLRFSAFAFDDADLERYWKRCLAFRPAYLYGYVSMLEAFAAFVERKRYDGRAIGARAVIATSEVLAPPQRALLERVFRTPVFVEYGCGEVGPIAYECEQGSLHIMSADLVVEFLDDRGEPVPVGEGGQIVLTDLNSRAMPLIRYRIGDNGIAGVACACGRSFPVLAKIWGRAYDVVQGVDGRRYHGEFFMYLFEDLRKAGHEIRQFQVVQDREDHLMIRVVAEAATLDRIVPVIGAHLADKLPGIAVTVERRDAIERSASGKTQVVRNLLLATTQPRAS
jgi:phenylacetate-CoA ligase